MTRMSERRAVALNKRALEIARALSAKVPNVDGVVLFGSVGRGDATRWSDIDLLVVGPDQSLTSATLANMLPDALRSDNLSIQYMTASNLNRQLREGSLFFAHLRQDGKLLSDRSGVLREMLASPFRARQDIAAEVSAQLDRLEPYKELGRFNGNFLFCLSRLYAIGKNIVILGLAADGVFEFNRELAFERFRRTHPVSAAQVETVARLRPFYNLVTRRRPEPLPFSYKGADKSAQEAISAITELGSIASHIA